MKKKHGGRDFPPGVSGNPSGRPPLPQEIKDARKVQGKVFAEYWIKDSNGIRIVEKLFEMALEGNPYAITVVLERVLGKVSDKIQHSVSKPTIMRLLDADGKTSGESLVFGREESN